MAIFDYCDDIGEHYHVLRDGINNYQADISQHCLLSFGINHFPLPAVSF